MYLLLKTSKRRTILRRKLGAVGWQKKPKYISIPANPVQIPFEQVHIERAALKDRKARHARQAIALQRAIAHNKITAN